MSQPNQFPAPCALCGHHLAAGDGIRYRSYAKRSAGKVSEWRTTCRGACMNSMGPLPMPTDAELYAQGRRLEMQRLGRLAGAVYQREFPSDRQYDVGSDWDAEAFATDVRGAQGGDWEAYRDALRAEVKRAGGADAFDVGLRRLAAASNAFHDDGSNPSSCAAYEDTYKRRCPCETPEDRKMQAEARGAIGTGEFRVVRETAPEGAVRVLSSWTSEKAAERLAASWRRSGEACRLERRTT